ncbi:30S ribosomal protein S9 [Patescibacteria group bacterium]|nr:30S ribosomal protein S9 [Patescibacteria group bacterium]
MATARYTEAVGRRKTASARVRLVPAGAPSVTVNGKNADVYFPIPEHQALLRAPLSVATETYAVTAIVRGGGIAAQAEAVRHGIARAVESLHGGARADLKKAGYLKRDPRAKERRKPGLKKARKSPQWSKR